MAGAATKAILRPQLILLLAVLRLADAFLGVRILAVEAIVGLLGILLPRFQLRLRGLEWFLVLDRVLRSVDGRRGAGRDLRSAVAQVSLWCRLGCAEPILALKG